ncbi:MAG: redoxin family protein [Myxococcota bacterium]|nr:redoxin family protein [Myxococcota bacterium]
MANKQTPPPAGSVVLTLPALAFSFAMLLVGSVGGYMVGKAEVAPATVEAPVATTGGEQLKGTVVNNTDGQLRRLSEDEKRRLLSKNKEKAPDKSTKQPPEAPADSPYMAPEILASIKDPVLAAEYRRVVGYMSKGNARAARPALVELEKTSSGTDWAEPVAALLCDARASVGDIAAGRKSIEAFKATWTKSPFLAQVWVADGKTHMHEGKRLKRKPGQATDGPLNADQKESYKEAIARFDKAISTWPDHPAVVDALLNKSALLIDLGDFDGAEAAAVQLADSFPKSKHGARALSNIGRHAMNSSNYEQAERVYGKVARDFPRDRLARSAQTQLQSLKMLGKPAPELDAEEWLGSDLDSLAALRGKTVMLVFWATWCPHCRKEMPRLQEFYDKHKGKDFEMITVTRNSKGQTTEKVRSYLQENGITIPAMVDPGTTSRAYGVSGIPAAALIDKNGQVVFRNHPSRVTDGLLAKHL